MIIVFKIGLLVGLLAIVRVYFVRARTPRRDRLLVLLMFGGLALAVVQPSTTSWLATRLGVGRGVDLAFYVGFMLLFFVAATQRAHLREQEHTIATLVREIALLRAHSPSGDEPPRGAASP